MDKRIEWLDIAKGIGILLVVVSHCVAVSKPICQIIFSFHMPLFFILSGYTFSAKHSFLTTLKKKASSLLLPFAAFFCVGLLTVLAVPAWRPTLTMEGIKSDLLYSAPNHVQNSSIWFLVCLFFVAMLYWLVSKLPIWVQVPLIGLLFAAAVWYARVRNQLLVFGHNRLPFTLDVVPAGLLFYALGHYARRFKLAEKATKHPVIEIAVAVVALAVTLLIYRHNSYVNTHALQYNNPILYILSGVFGTVAVFGVSALAVRIKSGGPYEGKRILMWYGRNSLFVLGFQSLLIRLYALACNTFLHTQLRLYGFPWSHAINSAILVAFMICPLLVFALNSLKKIKTKVLCRSVKD